MCLFRASNYLIWELECLFKQMMLYLQMERFMIPFKPAVDNRSRNPFMPVDFEVAANRGIQVPLLIGYTSREAMGYLPS